VVYISGFLLQFSSLSETLRFKWHVETFVFCIVRLSSVVYPTHKLEVSENGKLTKIFEPRDDKSRQFRMYNKLFGHLISTPTNAHT